MVVEDRDATPVVVVEDPTVVVADEQPCRASEMLTAATTAMSARVSHAVSSVLSITGSSSPATDHYDSTGGAAPPPPAHATTRLAAAPASFYGVPAYPRAGGPAVGRPVDENVTGSWTQLPQAP